MPRDRGVGWVGLLATPTATNETLAVPRSSVKRTQKIVIPKQCGVPVRQKGLRTSSPAADVDSLCQPYSHAANGVKHTRSRHGGFHSAGFE